MKTDIHLCHIYNEYYKFDWRKYVFWNELKAFYLPFDLKTGTTSWHVLLC